MLERRAFETPGPLRRAAGVDAADDAVETFWRRYRRSGEPAREAIEQLTEQALSEDLELAALGTRRLFAGVVEPLCDAFSARAAETYARVFAQVIAVARSSPQCAPLDAALEARGFFSELDLLAASVARSRGRGHAARGAPIAPLPSLVRSITVLSRLTLGADVAVVLPLLTRLRRQFPNAALRLAGTEGARMLVRGMPGIEHIAAPYGRTDTLQARLNAWPALCTALDSCGGEDGRDLVIDPDSRLTQLGLLPPVAARRYYHFPSRAYGGDGDSALSKLVGDWLDASFGPGEPTRPVLELCSEDARFRDVLRAALLKPRPRRIVSVSFGMGGNERKRAGLELEAELLEWIVRRDSRVLLARGTGLAELTQSERLCRRLARRGLTVLHLPRGRRLDVLQTSAADVVTWEADLGAFLAAIGCADMYVGYDSAGQHIAAALGVPTLSLFVESAGPRHGARWTPRGPAPIRVVRASCPPHAQRMLAAARSAFTALA